MALEYKSTLVHTYKSITMNSEDGDARESTMCTDGTRVLRRGNGLHPSSRVANAAARAGSSSRRCV